MLWFLNCSPPFLLPRPACSYAQISNVVAQRYGRRSDQLRLLVNGSRIDQSSASILEDMQGETIDVCWEQIGGVAEDKVLLKVEQILLQAYQKITPSLLHRSDFRTEMKKLRWL